MLNYCFPFLKLFLLSKHCQSLTSSLSLPITVIFQLQSKTLEKGVCCRALWPLTLYILGYRSLDQAILLLKELQNWKEISSVAHKACQLFQEHGSPDTAALLLDKSAKIIEQHLPEDALNLYK